VTAEPEFVNVHKDGRTVTVRGKDRWRWQAKGWRPGAGPDWVKSRGALKRKRRRQQRLVG
jgi:hypothetical protein